MKRFPDKSLHQSLLRKLLCNLVTTLRASRWGHKPIVLSIMTQHVLYLHDFVSSYSERTYYNCMHVTLGHMNLHEWTILYTEQSYCVCIHRIESYSVRSCGIFTTKLDGTVPVNEFRAILNSCIESIWPYAWNGKSPWNLFPLKSLFDIPEHNTCTEHSSGRSMNFEGKNVNWQRIGFVPEIIR